MIVLRDLTDIAACREVVRLQEAVWGRDGEIVPASVLLVSAKRGGILIGAFEDDRLVGFVWSMPGVRDERAHALVAHARRLAGRARTRRRPRAEAGAARSRPGARASTLIEWTFDPLQAANAHLNIATLGGVSSTYLVDAYGADGRAAAPRHADRSSGRRVVDSSAPRRAPDCASEPERRRASRPERRGRWSAPQALEPARQPGRQRLVWTWTLAACSSRFRRASRRCSDRTPTARWRGASRCADAFSAPISRAVIASWISGLTMHGGGVPAGAYPGGQLSFRPASTCRWM